VVFPCLSPILRVGDDWFTPLKTPRRDFRWRYGAFAMELASFILLTSLRYREGCKCHRFMPFFLSLYHFHPPLLMFLSVTDEWNVDNRCYAVFSLFSSSVHFSFFETSVGSFGLSRSGSPATRRLHAPVPPSVSFSFLEYSFSCSSCCGPKLVVRSFFLLKRIRIERPFFSVYVCARHSPPII